MEDNGVLEMVASVQWHHTFEVLPGVMTKGAYNPLGLWTRLDLPASLAGLRVLDIGARDGFFSFACEERGADVLAVDHISQESTGFGIASRLRKSNVQYLHENLYNLKPDTIGTFDIVLMLGVIYHVPDPVLALEIVRNLCVDRAQLYVESTCIDDAAVFPDRTVDTANLCELPILLFVHRNNTSFWDLNLKCLTELLVYSDFVFQSSQTWGQRMLVKAEYWPKANRYSPYAPVGRGLRK